MERLKQLFRTYTGSEPISIEPITGSGSNRKYFRMTDGRKSLIGVQGVSIPENKAFTSLCRHFRAKGIPVPELLAVSDDQMYYLQEDVGNISLFDKIQKQEDVHDLLVRTMQLLPTIQFRGAEDLDFSVCYPQSALDKRSILWDLNYFKYCFLKLSGLETEENLLEDDFERLSEILLKNQTHTFLYRDFQSRNVMIRDNQPYFIDFQGGRKGPVYYDVASFLWQAKARFSPELRSELVDIYLQSLSEYTNVNKQDFLRQLNYFVLFRTLQVLGAYGFRGYIEKKAHFIESIPPAIENLKTLLNENFTELPYLQSVLKQLSEMEKFRTQAKRTSLEIQVYSFSYKKGIPEDFSGHGGGYVFDCRGLHNPGLYPEYKKLTGRDEPVIRFLEEQGEIQVFLSQVYALAEKHIEKYLERGFTHLMFSFGCTGGQHRSVYCAQHVADYIRQKYPVKVTLIHREQQI